MVGVGAPSVLPHVMRIPVGWAAATTVMQSGRSHLRAKPASRTEEQSHRQDLVTR